MKPNRDETGRFAPGGPGGPGRPRRETPQIRPEDQVYVADLIQRANKLIGELGRFLKRNGIDG